MATSSAHFESRLKPILAQSVFELQQVFHGIFVIGINGQPFAALILGINRM
jgi:hypothetical protein